MKKSKCCLVQGKNDEGIWKFDFFAKQSDWQIRKRGPMYLSIFIKFKSNDYIDKQ